MEAVAGSVEPGRLLSTRAEIHAVGSAGPDVGSELGKVGALLGDTPGDLEGDMRGQVEAEQRSSTSPQRPEQGDGPGRASLHFVSAVQGELVTGGESPVLFGPSDLEDPFLCPNFDLGPLDDSASDGDCDTNSMVENNTMERRNTAFLY